MRAEKLFINGNIYTMNDEKTHAEALATTGQTILAVGSTVELMDLAGPDTEVIDLKGKTVIPGLIDNHIHSMGMGRMVDQDRVIQCFDKSKEEILEAVRKAVKQRKPGQWIQGMGWNQSGWLDSSMPTRQDLDDVAPENPVVLQRVCGHAIWVNSMALKQAGITRDSVAPAGSEILKDENGEPTGYLTETAGNDVQNCIPATDLDEMECSYRLIQEEMVKHGITAYTDKLLGCKAIADEPHVKDHLNLLDQLYAQRKMKIRLHTFCPPCDDLYELYKKGPQIGLYDGRLTHRGLKLYSDGALGARSAWLLEPYNDRPGHTGSGRMTDEYLQSEMKKAHDAGFQVSLHAIGDAAVKQAIDAYEAVNPNNEDMRFLIEHFMIVREDDFERLRGKSILASMQFVELNSDMDMVEERIGKERAKGAYAWRTVLESGGRIVSGTDCPVDSVNPFENLYFAVSRCKLNEEPQGGYRPQEALTRYEALKTYTLDGAYARFEEEILGSIKAGKYADFVVIDRDYMNCAVKEIKEIRALMTVIGGEVVYQKGEF